MNRIPDEVKAAMREVVDASDDTGCSDDLTVTSASAVDWLRELLVAYDDDDDARERTVEG